MSLSVYHSGTCIEEHLTNPQVADSLITNTLAHPS
jgi:hypothetical protein